MSRLETTTTADLHTEEQPEQPVKKAVVNKMVLLGDVNVGKTSIAYRFEESTYKSITLV